MERAIWEWHVRARVSTGDVGVRRQLYGRVGILILRIQNNEWRLESPKLSSRLTDSSVSPLSPCVSSTSCWEHDGPAPGAAGRFVLTYSEVLT